MEYRKLLLLVISFLAIPNVRNWLYQQADKTDTPFDNAALDMLYKLIDLIMNDQENHELLTQRKEVT
ncbi:MAG: hypothetical protein DRJ03_15080 [Chloroflexi bacterium]|nr:MAG: hypothetical protein DRJ03_15080 [Chloroflexota bacterium]